MTATANVHRLPDGRVGLTVEDQPANAGKVLDRDEAIALGRALIDAAGGINVLGTPGALNRHDTALRAVTTAVNAALAEGATVKAVIERVLLGVRLLSLLGPRERDLAEAIATAVRNLNEEPTR